MFEGFVLETVDVGAVRLRVRHGGRGPAVLLLLHGHPRTQTTWYRVAPQLAERYTVVCPDLRGYGRSDKPLTTSDHAPYSKRATAGDCPALMRRLGHDRFAVFGHDRGGYVALRLALDHPDAVRRLVLGDCLPISEHLARCDERFARPWWHWFFFAQPDKPERSILADPHAWYGGTPERMGSENWRDFQAAVADPATVRACWRTTAPGSVSTDGTSSRTGTPAAGSAARCCCSTPGTTTCARCTRISTRSGGTGRATCTPPPSTVDTTWPRTHPVRSPNSSTPSSADHSCPARLLWRRGTVPSWRFRRRTGATGTRALILVWPPPSGAAVRTPLDTIEFTDASTHRWYQGRVSCAGSGRSVGQHSNRRAARVELRRPTACR